MKLGARSYAPPLLNKASYRQHNVRLTRGPLEFAPELVVEIVSDSDTKSMLAAKIVDYASIGVSKCCVVRPDDETVEALTLKDQRMIPTARYELGQEVQSVVFPNLRVLVADIYAD